MPRLTDEQFRLLHVVTIVDVVSLDDVRAAKPKTIYYGANTCWWTHDPAHVCSVRHGKYRLPCDPVGGMLFMTDDIEGFLASAEKNTEHYGKYGLTAFIAAHHSNCLKTVPWLESVAFPEWSTYEAVLDQQGGRPMPMADVEEARLLAQRTIKRGEPR